MKNRLFPVWVLIALLAASCGGQKTEQQMEQRTELVETSALAMSDISQNLAVDTLFIDEGFGSLSGEPLQNAITTLRMLHKAGGRHVGIISHVEELREKIPVQIRVDQDAKSSSSKVSVV